MYMDKNSILLVEDNAVLQDALKEILSVNDFHVFTAGNGKEALALMEIVQPDLIISDITMPEMDGRTFFKKVRERSDWIAIPFIFLTARGKEEEVISGKGLGVEDYLVKPVNQEELIITVRARLKRAQQLEMVKLQEAYESSLMMLANAIEARDRYTRGHIERVRNYSLALGRQLGWSKTRLQELRFGAILHDIGKIHIGESLLQKDTPLNQKEWEIIRTHPVVGEEMLRDIPYLASALPVVRYHHERWDGSGYPEGLEGTDIPPAARIVAVADVFDAMTSVRVYQRARTLEKAYQEILAGSETAYAPEVVEAFQHLWDVGIIQDIAQDGERSFSI